MEIPDRISKRSESIVSRRGAPKAIGHRLQLQHISSVDWLFTTFFGHTFESNRALKLTSSSLNKTELLAAVQIIGKLPFLQVSSSAVWVCCELLQFGQCGIAVRALLKLLAPLRSLQLAALLESLEILLCLSLFFKMLFDGGIVRSLQRWFKLQIALLGFPQTVAALTTRSLDGN